jgi:hypothetical protein
VSDNPDNSQAEDEEVTSHLFALLYPDEDVAESAGTSDYEDATELSDFRSVLGHFRDLPEEEPPPAVSNKLLALAAQHAPAARKVGGKSIWERLSDFLLPAVYHPGLASAATLVLVAGLGATLYVNGKSQVAEPMVATEAAAPQQNQALGIVNLQEQAEDSAKPGEESPAALADEAATAAVPTTIAPEAEPTDQVATGALEKKARNEVADDGLKFKAGAKRDSSLDGVLGGALGGGGKAVDIGGDSSTTRNGRKTRDSNRESITTTGDKEARRAQKKTKNKPSVDARKSVNKGTTKRPAPKTPVAKPKLAAERESDSKDKAEPAPTPAADPAPPPPSPTGGTTRGSEDSKPEAPGGAGAGDDDDDDADEGEGEEAVAEPAKKPADSAVAPATAAAALHKKAITAAKKNQCAKVKSLGQQIRKVSSSYYDRTFLSDKRLTACLAPEVKK